ncbi:MAG: hypothetical protein R3D33_00730 [Hyphomicrobiaceae bacterium]
MSVASEPAPRLPMPFRSPYWSAVAALLMAEAVVVAGAASLLGLGLADLSAASGGIVLLHVAALALLFWPAAAVSIRRLKDGRSLAWLCLPLYALAVFAFMAVFFGKPLALGGTAILLPLPALMVLGLVAWLTVDCLAAGSDAETRMDRTPPAAGGPA